MTPAETIKRLEAVREWLIERRDEQSQPDYIDEYEGRIATIESALAALRESQSAHESVEARKDAAYLERNKVVAALAKCFPAGRAKTAIEGWSDDWHGCVYIDLPNGQVSWHYHDSQADLFDFLPPYKGAWDGHSTEEKYERLARLELSQSAREKAAREAVQAISELGYPELTRICEAAILKHFNLEAK